MDEQTRDILKDCGVSRKAARLPWVLQFDLGPNTLRVEVLKTSNKQAPWHADAYQKTTTGWRRIADLDADERHKEAAIRWVLSQLAQSYCTEGRRKTRS